MKRRLTSGNAELDKEAELPEASSDDPEFEKAALAKLGGSIAFVRKGSKLIEK